MHEKRDWIELFNINKAGCSNITQKKANGHSDQKQQQQQHPQDTMPEPGWVRNDIFINWMLLVSTTKQLSALSDSMKCQSLWMPEHERLKQQRASVLFKGRDASHIIMHSCFWCFDEVLQFGRKGQVRFIMPNCSGCVVLYKPAVRCMGGWP